MEDIESYEEWLNTVDGYIEDVEDYEQRFESLTEEIESLIDKLEHYRRGDVAVRVRMETRFEGDSPEEYTWEGMSIGIPDPKASEAIREAAESYEVLNEELRGMERELEERQEEKEMLTSESIIRDVEIEGLDVEKWCLPFSDLDYPLKIEKPLLGPQSLLRSFEREIENMNQLHREVSSVHSELTDADLPPGWKVAARRARDDFRILRDDIEENMERYMERKKVFETWLED